METKAEQLKKDIIDWSQCDPSDSDDAIELILQAFKEVAEAQRIADREDLFKQFAINVWGCYMEDEDGNINERECAIGYDENGVPNSVSLEIYGRSHSDFGFTLTPLVTDNPTDHE